jgi:FkbM family methyltransferase
MKKMINRVLRSMGIQIKRYPDINLKRRIKIMENCKIDTLFDIGANIGQYAQKMRELGYNKKIISFEPLESAFTDLKKASLKDDNWTVNNYAIGNEDGVCIINVASNSYSSSILNMLPKHTEGAPDSKYIAQQEIEIKKLDSVFDRFTNNNNKVMLKIDTQGFEKNVIDGALNSIKKLWLSNLRCH